MPIEKFVYFLIALPKFFIFRNSAWCTCCECLFFFLFFFFFKRGDLLLISFVVCFSQNTVELGLAAVRQCFAADSTARRCWHRSRLCMNKPHSSSLTGPSCRLWCGVAKKLAKAMSHWPLHHSLQYHRYIILMLSLSLSLPLSGSIYHRPSYTDNLPYYMYHWPYLPNHLYHRHLGTPPVTWTTFLNLCQFPLRSAGDRLLLVLFLLARLFCHVLPHDIFYPSDVSPLVQAPCLPLQTILILFLGWCWGISSGHGITSLLIIGDVVTVVVVSCCNGFSFHFLNQQKRK